MRVLETNCNCELFNNVEKFGVERVSVTTNVVRGMFDAVLAANLDPEGFSRLLRDAPVNTTRPPSEPSARPDEEGKDDAKTTTTGVPRNVALMETEIVRELEAARAPVSKRKRDFFTKGWELVYSEAISPPFALAPLEACYPTV